MTGRMKAALFVLASAKAIMIIDIAFGAVVLDDVMKEFHSSVAVLQGVLAGYALIIAAFALTGGWFGSRFGDRHALRVGLAIRVVGAAVTACAFNIWSYAFGEAMLAGIGIALVSPATRVLPGAIFSGRDRARAYATIGVSIALATGVGPVLGGLITTTLGWRWCNWLEFALTSLILAGTIVIPVVERAVTHTRLDIAGMVTSALGLAAIITALTRASAWGWWSDNSSPVAPFGLALTPFVLAAGVLILVGFLSIERRRERLGLPVLLDPELLRNRGLRATLLATTTSQAALSGVLFIVPVYLQIIEGRSAFESGLYLLPLAGCAFAISMFMPRLTARFTADRLGMFAGVCMILSALMLYWHVSPALWGSTLLVALGVFGVGCGIMDSQLDSVALDTVSEERSSEVGGLQCTVDNFGSAFGIALVGTVLIISLSSGMSSFLSSDAGLSQAVRDTVGARIAEGTPLVTNDEARAYSERLGEGRAQVDRVVSGYERAQEGALESAMFAVGGLAVIALAAASRLPRRRADDAKPIPVES